MTFRRLIGALCGSVFALSIVGVSGAQAQSTDTGGDANADLVAGRGIRLDTFLLTLGGDENLEYNDNVYASNSNKKNDWLFDAEPYVKLQSLWGRHSLAFNFSGIFDQYNQLSSEDTDQEMVSVNGRLDVHEGTALYGNAFFDNLAEARTDDSNRDSSLLLTPRPVQYQQEGGGLTLDHTFNWLKIELGGNFIRYDYQDQLLSGGGISDQDVRDHDVQSYTGRLHYMISPDTSIFVGGSYYTWDYRLKPPFAFTNRDADGYTINGGSVFKLGSHLMSGEIYGGYASQSFDDPASPDVNTFDYGVSVNWFPTPLMTVRLSGQSTISPSTVANSSSYIDRGVTLDVTHSLTREITLTGDLSYANDHFEGITRTDDRYGAGFHAAYTLNRWFDLYAGYDYLRQDSTLTNNTFGQNLFTAGLRIRG
jgi:hypothetical protein